MFNSNWKQYDFKVDEPSSLMSIIEERMTSEDETD
jgi:hypothetical protein